MFDISFGELLLVVVLAVVFIGPKELPVVVRALARSIIHIKKFMHEVKEMMNELAREAGVEDLKREMEEEFSRDITMIKGDDGEWYESYDISDFVTDDTVVKKTDIKVQNVSSEDEVPTSDKP